MNDDYRFTIVSNLINNPEPLLSTEKLIKYNYNYKYLKNNKLINVRKFKDKLLQETLYSITLTFKGVYWFHKEMQKLIVQTP